MFNIVHYLFFEKMSAKRERQQAILQDFNTKKPKSVRDLKDTEESATAENQLDYREKVELHNDLQKQTQLSGVLIDLIFCYSLNIRTWAASCKKCFMHCSIYDGQCSECHPTKDIAAKKLGLLDWYYRDSCQIQVLENLQAEEFVRPKNITQRCDRLMKYLQKQNRYFGPNQLPLLIAWLFVGVDDFGFMNSKQPPPYFETCSERDTVVSVIQYVYCDSRYFSTFSVPEPTVQKALNIPENPIRFMSDRTLSQFLQVGPNMRTEFLQQFNLHSQHTIAPFVFKPSLQKVAD